MTVTATAMPQTPPPGRGIHELVRQESVNYQDILSSDRYGARQPTFSDYGVATRTHSRIQPPDVQIKRKLKYACGDKSLLARGGFLEERAAAVAGAKRLGEWRGCFCRDGSQFRAVERRVDFGCRRHRTFRRAADVGENGHVAPLP